MEVDGGEPFGDEPGNLTENNGCCSRCKAEFSASFFTLVEANGRIIDVERTFAPKRRYCITFLYRLGVFGGLLAVMFYDIFERRSEDSRFIYMGFLSNVSLVFAELYFLLAIYVTLWRKALAQPSADSIIHRPKFMVRFMWALYSVVTCAELILTLLYWLIVYDPKAHTIDLINLMKHGGFTLLLYIDGVFLSKIPIRFKQFLFLFLYTAAYVIWTIIHDFSGIGTGGDQDNVQDTENGKEDSLYEVLSWSTDAGQAILYTVIVLFGVTPIVFLFTWSLTLCGRRTLHGNDIEYDTKEDVENPIEYDAARPDMMDAEIY
jgi:hypothetical protein